jgi:hypothetical protein
VEGEPGGVAAIGGLRYGLHDLQTRVAKCIPGAHVEVVADPVLGERIRIEAVDPAAAAAALRSAGHAEQLIEAVAPATKRRATG